jgi:LysR family cys regulon transcriptional activator
MAGDVCGGSYFSSDKRQAGPFTRIANKLMTLTQLRHLVAIVDCGLNISLAAERVHATQPGLSKHLRHLEEELGFPMFNRRGRNLESLTHVGGRVLESARMILAEVDSIRSVVATMHGVTRTMLRIATTHTQARFALPTAIGALSQRFPSLSVHLQPTADALLLDVLDSDGADIAIVSTSGGPPKTNGLALPAYRWHRVALVPRTLAELAGVPLISYDSSLKADSSLRQIFEAAGLHPQIAMTAGDADLIKTYVNAGLGVGILAEMALQPADAEHMRSLPADHLFPTCTTWIVLRRESPLREQALEFVAQFAPHLDRGQVSQALASGINVSSQWPAAPYWHQSGSASGQVVPFLSRGSQR